MLSITEIRNKAKPVAKKYGVINLSLFGSYANRMANENSDADFLVRFDTPVPSIFKVMGFREELSQALGIPVDVITLPLVRPEKLHISKTETII